MVALHSLARTMTEWTSAVLVEVFTHVAGAAFAEPPLNVMALIFLTFLLLLGLFRSLPVAGPPPPPPPTPAPVRAAAPLPSAAIGAVSEEVLSQRHRGNGHWVDACACMHVRKSAAHLRAHVRKLGMPACQRLVACLEGRQLETDMAVNISDSLGPTWRSISVALLRSNSCSFASSVGHGDPVSPSSRTTDSTTPPSWVSARPSPGVRRVP